jgi:hypothetical protein
VNFLIRTTPLVGASTQASSERGGVALRDFAGRL